MKNDYIQVPKRTVKKLRLDNFFKGLNATHDESVLSPMVSAETYNFDFSSGALTQGGGIIAFNAFLCQNIVSLWQFSKTDSATGVREEIPMCATDDGRIYYLKAGVQHELEGVTASGKTRGINYRLYGEDVILICSSSANMIVWNGVDTPYTVPDSPRIKSLAVHNNRMFVIDADGETLRFSDDLDPTNWNYLPSQGGFLQLTGEKGRLNKLISFLNYVYVFRDGGISRVSFANGQLSEAGLFVSGGKIYAETAALCGDRIIFMATDGLYSFDGLNAKRILPYVFGAFIPSQTACGAYYNGRYYLSLKIRGEGTVGCEAGDFTNNAMLCLDPISGSYCLTRGIDICCFEVFLDKLIALSAGRAGEIVKEAVNFGAVLPKKWRGPLTDLNSEKCKVLKEIYIENNKNITLTVYCDGVQRAFSIQGSNVPNRVKIGIKGYKMGFAIESDQPDIKVSRPVLVLS